MAIKKKATKKGKKVVLKKSIKKGKKTTIKRKVTSKKIKKSVKKIKKASIKSIKRIVTDAGIVLEKIGEVTHFFPHVNAAAVKLEKGGIRVGDEVYIKGHTTDFKEKVDSIQLDHANIAIGKKGQEIGLRVNSRVRIGDKVYKI